MCCIYSYLQTRLCYYSAVHYADLVWMFWHWCVSLVRLLYLLVLLLHFAWIKMYIILWVTRMALPFPIDASTLQAICSVSVLMSARNRMSVLQMCSHHRVSRICHRHFIWNHASRYFMWELRVVQISEYGVGSGRAHCLDHASESYCIIRGN